VIQIDPPQSYGVVQYFAHARGARTPWLAAQPPVPARRQPDVAGDRRRLRARRRGILSYSAPPAALPTTRVWRTGPSRCRIDPASVSRGRQRYRIMRELAGI